MQQLKNYEYTNMRYRGVFESFKYNMHYLSVEQILNNIEEEVTSYKEFNKDIIEELKTYKHIRSKINAYIEGMKFFEEKI